jgi:hypothetical protein
MIKDARDRLIEEMRSDVDTFTATSGRIYPQDIATLLNPVYPCVTVAFNGGVPDVYLSQLADASVSIKAYSTKSFNQSWEIYEKFKSALAFGVFADADVRIRTTESVTPIEQYDSIGRVYSVISGWDITIIGT